MGKKARLNNEKKRGLSGQVAPQQAETEVESALAKPVAFILIISALLLGVTLRIYNVSDTAKRSPDEKVYTLQAAKISQNGWKGLRSLVDSYDSNRIEWKFPPPTRVGYLIPLAMTMKIMGRTDSNVGAYLSCFFSVVTLGLLILCGLRFFNQWIAIYALLFLSVSPVDLAIARRTWQEALLGCAGFFLLYVCCEIIRGGRRRIWCVLFVLAGSYCMLIKEPGATFYALCTAWIFLVFFIKEKSFAKAFLFICLSALGVGISLALLSCAAGGTSNYIRVLAHIKEAMPENSYATTYQSGPWYHFFGAFWRVSPWNAVLFLFGIAGMFLSGTLPGKAKMVSDNSRSSVFGIIFFMIGLMIIIVTVPYQQNLRYVSVLYGPFYLIGGLGLWLVSRLLRIKLYKPIFSVLLVCIVVAVIAGAITDYMEFVKVYKMGKSQDLTIWHIRSYARQLGFLNRP
ncbi:MAG: hypothetical protein A2Z72_04195 [Omnitrophica bacterium RBG_13_46_9]|nr:MAG: hypothetical protein A2Z72_04195 [Omnitrophica bacterium RBG_13_46_9]